MTAKTIKDSWGGGGQMGRWQIGENQQVIALRFLTAKGV